MEREKKAVCDDVDETKNRKQRLEQDVIHVLLKYQQMLCLMKLKAHVPTTMTPRSTVCAELLNIKNVELKNQQMNIRFQAER